MANSLLLRDSAGITAGYVQRSAETVRCRLTVPASAQRGRLVLVFEDGRTAGLDLRMQGDEQAWTVAPGRLTGAWVAAEGRLLLASDAAARSMGERRLAAERPRAHPPVGPSQEEETKPCGSDEAEEACAEPDGGGKVGAQRLERSLSERRWPPPPCLSRAMYEDGVWVSRGERTSAVAAPAHGAP